jgi:hypothetical protein
MAKHRGWNTPSSVITWCPSGGEPGLAPNASRRLAAANLASAAAVVGALSLISGSKDAAALVRLPPGGYTIVVSGADGGTGTVLLEVYDVDALP